MDKYKWIIIVLFLLLNINIQAKSTGEIIYEFVTNSVLSQTFTDFDKIGENVRNQINSFIPVSFVDSLYEIVKTTSLIANILEELQAPDDINLEEFFKVLKEISNNKEIVDVTKGLKDIIGEIKDVDLKNLIEFDEYNLNIQYDDLVFAKEFVNKIKYNEDFNIIDDKTKDYEYVDNNDYSSNSSENILLNLFSQFLKIIKDNAEFIKKTEQVLGFIDTTLNADKLLKESVINYINENESEVLDKYNIDSEDIDLAASVLNNPQEFSFDTLKPIISVILQNDKLVGDVSKIFALMDEVDTSNLTDKERLNYAIKVISLLPELSEAIKKISFN